MSKLYIDGPNTILDVPVEVKYVDSFITNNQVFHLVDAWVNYGTELEVKIAETCFDENVDQLVEYWLDDPESFYGEPEIA